MWGILRALGLIGAAGAASIAISTFFPGAPFVSSNLAVASMVTAIPIIGCVVMFGDRIPGGPLMPGEEAAAERLPAWVNAAVKLISILCFGLAIYSHVTGTSGTLVVEGDRYFALRGTTERTEITREQYERGRFMTERFFGSIGVFLNLNAAIATVPAKRRRNPTQLGA